MIVDTSVLIAISRREPDAGSFTDAIDSAEHVRISAANLFEAFIVVDRVADRTIPRRFDDLCRKIGFDVVPFDEHQARIAREAYRDFGKGSGHPAKLNFGDCFAYALAKASDEPLLYKGTDFSHTDVASALG
jgi:ribonuclease VapC